MKIILKYGLFKILNNCDSSKLFYFLNFFEMNQSLGVNLLDLFFSQVFNVE